MQLECKFSQLIDDIYQYEFYVGKVLEQEDEVLVLVVVGKIVVMENEKLEQMIIIFCLDSQIR